MPHADIKSRKEYNKKWRKDNAAKIKARHKSLRSSPGRFLTSAKLRAKRDGIDFNITKEDIIVPTVCPVLGIKLFANSEVAGPNSPSLDRIDSTKGYIKGNVCVISWRANRLKSDATVDELAAVVKYMKENNKK